MVRESREVGAGEGRAYRSAESQPRFAHMDISGSLCLHGVNWELGKC